MNAPLRVLINVIGEPRRDATVNFAGVPRIGDNIEISDGEVAEVARVVWAPYASDVDLMVRVVRR